MLDMDMTRFYLWSKFFKTILQKTVEIFGEKGKAISANQQIAQWQVWKADGQSTDAIKQSFKQRYHDAYVAELEEFHAIITGEKQDMSVVPADW